ncbi:hypothetical protein [Kribbella pratensis]|uniref:Uncharacterized protein n=1 Tax=Kribbella pratensis TaxID=2512112 RepID=A0A4R8CME9_9ACTN|nr:hypothetical protein [Kribbella pratensis]TDW77214.1 hypothetical protein EV653_2379 [Kribbella pratensis]
MKIPRRTLEALPLSICLATSGYIHAQLYVRSYHFIPTIGPSFHWDAAASMAVAVLLLIRNAGVLRILAAGLCLSGLGGFTLSRTVGLFGFTERGWQPSPQAPLSVVAWVAALVLLLVPAIRQFREHQDAGEHVAVGHQ